jgi:hypothetical protein
MKHLKIDAKPPGPGINKKVYKQKYKGYSIACQKLAAELAVIQQYLPEWKPQLTL